MTEAEWLACDDPTPMLEFVRDRVADRKLRLFAVACCRNIWSMLTDDRSRNAVEAAEQFADGAITSAQLEGEHESARNAREQAYYAVHGPAVALVTERNLPLDECIHGVWECAMDASAAACAADDASAADPDEIIHAATAATLAAAHLASPKEFSEDCNPDFSKREEAEQRQMSAQAGWLRDVLGNPIRSSVFEPAWRTTTVTLIAQAAYTDRTFDRLPTLADALEDAGCTSRDILDHCRQPGTHVRGCWVVDLVLGKQ